MRPLLRLLGPLVFVVVVVKHNGSKRKTMKKRLSRRELNIMLINALVRPSVRPMVHLPYDLNLASSHIERSLGIEVVGT